MTRLIVTFLESGRTYGSPPDAQIRAAQPTPQTTTRLTQVDRCRAAAPNLLEQYFEADRPNPIWKADVTCIPTKEGWVYLAAVMDPCTRKIVGWSIKDTLATELTLEPSFVPVDHALVGIVDDVE